MKIPYDILLGKDDDLLTQNGDLVVGNSLTQEVGIILRLNQGDLKSDPILGPNLIQMINGTANTREFKERIKLHLKRDNKQYDTIKDLIHQKIQTQ